MLSIPKIFEDIPALEKSLRKKPTSYWENRGNKRVLLLFSEMSKNVPAYGSFLRGKNVSTRNVSTIQKLEDLPSVDKRNYLRRYSIEELTWAGRFKEERWTISSTSGSTGEPFYFPRQLDQDLQYAAVAELYLRTNFNIHKTSTLYVNAFPLGVWIGGIFTYEAVRILSERGNYALSIINPGVHKDEVIKAIKSLGRHFDQVVIGSYGPFLKDILDDGERMGIKWHTYNLKFVFSAEGFSEEFRDYILHFARPQNIYTATLNHYGTVDLGTMSYETPLAILIRRLTLKNPSLYKDVFGITANVPTLTQYIPELFYFEEQRGRLYCSAASGLPLMRYDLKDRGGVITFNDMFQRCMKHGVDLKKEARQADITRSVWRLPFVYVHERSDFSVSLYAFQIFPQTIRRALQYRSIKKKVTGKFTMLVIYTNKQDQRLDVYVELSAGVKPTAHLKKEICARIVTQLLAESSEYRETFKGKGKKIYPHITLRPYEDPEFFKSGAKQKWVKKAH